MERVLQDEGATNFKSRDHGNVNKSSETSPRSSYQGLPTMRYGLPPKSRGSADGASETNHILDQDKAETNPKVLPEKPSMEDPSENLILPIEGSTERSLESQPPKSYKVSPTMRYRALSEKRSEGADNNSETQSNEPSNEKIFSMVAASEAALIPHQANEHDDTQALFDTGDQSFTLTSDDVSIEKSCSLTLEKSSPAFFKPGKCPYPYLDRPKQDDELHLDVSAVEKQESLQNVPSHWQDSKAEFQGGDAENQTSVLKSTHDFSTQVTIWQQGLLEDQFKMSFARGDFASIASFFTRMHMVESALQDQVIEKFNSDIQYSAVMALMKGLVEGYSKQDFQVDLQKLLIDARKLQKRTNRSGNRSGKIVPGRADLCRFVQEEVLASIGLPETATISMWKMVGVHSHKQEIVWNLSILDELLALPQNSNLKVAQDCRAEGHL